MIQIGNTKSGVPTGFGSNCSQRMTPKPQLILTNCSMELLMKNTSTFSEQDKDYVCRLNRNLVFAELTRYFTKKAESEGLTQKRIAERLNMDVGQVCRLLSEPRNLTLDSISKLLLAMDAQMNFQVEPVAPAPAIDEFMDNFETWSQRNQLTSGSTVVSFVDRSQETVKPTISATNPSVVSSFGESDGRQAIG